MDRLTSWRSSGIDVQFAPATFAIVATTFLILAAAVGPRVVRAQDRHGLLAVSTDRRWSLSPRSAPAITVADLIGTTTIGSAIQGYGDVDYDVVSPDGAHIAIVVKRGNLERNSVDFALVVFRTADLLRDPQPDTLATFASSSNRPAIAHVRWLNDNATLAFLAERLNELPQVYTLDSRTRQLTQRTRATAVIVAFDVAGTGEPVVYATETPRDTSGYAAMRAHGFVVAQRALVSDVIAGDWGLPVASWKARTARVLHVVWANRETTVPVPDSAAGYRACQVDWRFATLSLAPGGAVALLQCQPRTVPNAWTGYRQPQIRWGADKGYIANTYVVVDLTTGRVRPLMNTPVDYSTTFAWAPDGRSVVVANAVLPLDSVDSAERTARATRETVAEVDVRTGAITIVARRDSLVAFGWDPRTETVTLAPGEYRSLSDTRRLYYRKTTTGWGPVSPNRRMAPQVPLVVIDQGMNLPKRLVAVDPRTQARHVIYDPTPGLLTRYRFGREELIHWKAKAGTVWAGGLYWPPDYQPGRRYPLLIQRHGFDSTAFWPYGVYSSGEAAQPLANLGIMVLQMPDPPSESWETPREGPLSMEGAEGAIDYLDSLGLIDRTNVGMQGFSRTCYYTLYFLTHSHYPIAAATLTDGVDFSYLSYLLIFGQREMEPGTSPEFERINGGKAWGTGLATWRERAPGFNLDRITTPLQLTALTAPALLEEWEPYAGLLLQGKPAELVYLPDGEHILTKPWERLTSQQGAVDWYRFWLQGQEDPNPAKSNQYSRWRTLRKLQRAEVTQTSPAVSETTR